MIEEKPRRRVFLIVKRIRDAIPDETFKPGERLPEEQVGKMFDFSRSPVREALFALENEGTVVMESFKGATLKPLSAEEALDIAELRLSLITLAVKAAQRHLSPADFDLAYRLAKQTTRTTSAKEYFDDDRRFWDIIFEKAKRPILWEVFRQLDDRMTRYHPLFLKLFPDWRRDRGNERCSLNIFGWAKLMTLSGPSKRSTRRLLIRWLSILRPRSLPTRLVNSSRSFLRTTTGSNATHWRCSPTVIPDLVTLELRYWLSV